MKTRTRPPLLALVLLALVLLAGCGLGQLPEGPLGKQPENYTVVGQPVREGGADTISDEVVTNDGRSTCSTTSAGLITNGAGACG